MAARIRTRGFLGTQPPRSCVTSAWTRLLLRRERPLRRGVESELEDVRPRVVAGDVWWLAYEVSGTDPLRWTGLGGTGTFANIHHSGTTVTLAEWGDGKFIGRWEGTMKKK